MKAIDTHAHLDFEQFDDDRTELISRLKKDNIGVIIPSSDLKSVDKVNELSKNNDLIWGAVGLHPSEVEAVGAAGIIDFLNKLKTQIETNKKIVAIGEIGLDYKEADNVKIQQGILRQFLTFAKECDLPVILHCREAWGDFLTIVGDYKPLKGVVHCFSATGEEAKTVIDCGLNISFTANLTYGRNETLRDVLKDIDLGKLLLETDSPFLSTELNRGKRNDPYAIFEVAKVIASQKNVSKEKVVKTTTTNAVNLFNLKV